MLRAFLEVENALANRSEAVRIATVRYLANWRDLLWVSHLQSGQSNNELSVLKQRGLQRINRIQLHLGLGGSFEAAAAVTPASSTQLHGGVPAAGADRAGR